MRETWQEYWGGYIINWVDAVVDKRDLSFNKFATAILFRKCHQIPIWKY